MKEKKDNAPGDESFKKICLISTLSPLRSHKIFSLLFPIQFLWCQWEEFGIKSNNNLLIDIFALFLSLVFLIFHRYQKWKFHLGHSWELAIPWKSVQHWQLPITHYAHTCICVCLQNDTPSTIWNSTFQPPQHTNCTFFDVLCKLADLLFQVFHNTGWLWCASCLRNWHNLSSISCFLVTGILRTTYKLYASELSSTTWNKDTIILNNHAFTLAFVWSSSVPLVMREAIAVIMHMLETAFWGHQ